MGVARDVAIIVLAVESIIIGALLCFLIIQIQRLIKMLREEIKPVLDSTNDTVSTVRGTATFVSDHLVSPMVQVASFFSGVRRASQVLRKWPTRPETRTAAPPVVERATTSDDDESPAAPAQSPS